MPRGKNAAARAVETTSSSNSPSRLILKEEEELSDDMEQEATPASYPTNETPNPTSSSSNSESLVGVITAFQDILRQQAEANESHATIDRRELQNERAAVTDSTQTKVIFRKPPTFSGRKPSKGLTPIRWIYQMKQFYKAINVTDPQKKLLSVHLLSRRQCSLMVDGQ
jgi:hypothetical protein